MRLFLMIAMLFPMMCLAKDVTKAPEPLWIVIVGLAILIIEFILGKTKFIKPNSIIDTVLQVILKIGRALIGKK